MATPFAILTEGGQDIDAESGQAILVDVPPPPAVGSQADIVGRLKNLMPPGWFALGETPIRDALLTGIANAFAFIFSLFAYLKLQTRIATATDGFLDLISLDYLGPTLPRLGNQLDQSYRSRIKSALLPLRNTRPAIINALTSVTGRAPIVIEPQRPADIGGYTIGTVAYNTAGFYGSAGYPFQSFVTAFRPLAGSPQVGITDADIYAAVESVRMAGTIVWVRILN